MEVKTALSVDDVNGHIGRIEIIRRYMDARGDARKLVGAAATAIVNEGVIAYAQKKGLYVFVLAGDTIAIADAPQGFKAREW